MRSLIVLSILSIFTPAAFSGATKGYEVVNATIYQKDTSLNPKYVLKTSTSSVLLVSTKGDGADNTSILLSWIDNSGVAFKEKEISSNTALTSRTGISIPTGFWIFGQESSRSYTDEGGNYPKAFAWKYTNEDNKIQTAPISAGGTIETALMNSADEIILGGIYTPSGMGGCSLLAKLTPNGNVAWKKNYFCNSETENGVYSVVIASSWTYIAVAYYGDNYKVFYVDSNGKMLWDKEYPAKGTVPASIVKEGDEFVILGTDESKPQIYFLRIDNTGKKISDKVIQTKKICSSPKMKMVGSKYLVGGTSIGDPLFVSLLEIDKSLSLVSETTIQGSHLGDFYVDKNEDVKLFVRDFKDSIYRVKTITMRPL